MYVNILLHIYSFTMFIYSQNLMLLQQIAHMTYEYFDMYFNVKAHHFFYKFFETVPHKHSNLPHLLASMQVF